MSGGASTLVISQSARANSNVLAQDTIDPFTGDVDANAISVSGRVESAETIQRRLDAQNRTQIEQEACYPQLNMYNLVVNAFGRITVPSVPAVMTTMVIHNNTMPVWNYEFRVRAENAHEVAFEMMHYVADHDKTHWVIAEKIVDFGALVPDPQDRTVHKFAMDLDVPGGMGFTNWNDAVPRFRVVVQRVAGTGNDDPRGTCSETTESSHAPGPTCSLTTTESGTDHDPEARHNPGHVRLIQVANRSEACSQSTSSRATEDEWVFPIAVAGYYPLYMHRYYATRASPENGVVLRTFDGVDYFMPTGVRQYLGDLNDYFLPGDLPHEVYPYPGAAGPTSHPNAHVNKMYKAPTDTDTCSQTSTQDLNLHDMVRNNTPVEISHWFYVTLVGAGPLSLPVRGRESARYFSTILYGHSEFLRVFGEVEKEIRYVLDAASPPQRVPLSVYGSSVAGTGFYGPLFQQETEGDVRYVFAEYPADDFWGVGGITPVPSAAVPGTTLYVPFAEAYC